MPDNPLDYWRKDNFPLHTDIYLTYAPTQSERLFSRSSHILDDKRNHLSTYKKWRVPPSQYQKLKQTLDEMEEKGIISKSSSEWASPLVLVWKPSGELRICTDFRWMNQRTEKDAYPLPHQADALTA